jgi:hypothetical protein
LPESGGNMKGCLLSIAFLIAFAGCAAQKSNTTKTSLPDYSTLEKIELSFLKLNTAKNVEHAHWQELLSIIETAEYDIDQYDEKLNPNGYQAKIAQPDYSIKLFYKDSTITEILSWTNAGNMLMNGKWYHLKEEGQLESIIGLYK